MQTWPNTLGTSPMKMSVAIIAVALALPNMTRAQSYAAKTDHDALVQWDEDERSLKDFVTAGYQVVSVAPRETHRDGIDECPAAGSADTELGVLLEPEVGHEATEVYATMQARGGEADQGAWGKCRAGLARSGCARDSAAQLGEGVCG